MNHMTTVESVVTEIGLTRLIVYDIYYLCDYDEEEKLNYFTVSKSVLSSSSHLNGKLQMKRIGFSDKRSHGIKE